MAQTSINTLPTIHATNPEVVQSFGVERLQDDDATTLSGGERDTGPGQFSTQSTKLHEDKPVISSLDTPTYFEAWEVISVPPIKELTSFKRVCGITTTSIYKTGKGGYAGVRPIVSYTQAELVQVVGDAEQQWNNKIRANKNIFRRFFCFGPSFGPKKETYVQNLARRLFELPSCLPSKLGALLDSRFVATNKTPYFRREWKIVLLQPMPGVLTDEAPRDDKNRKTWFWNYPEEIQRDPVQKWLVILRGHNTAVSDQGFTSFNTLSNPWISVDTKLHQERHQGPPRSQ